MAATEILSRISYKTILHERFPIIKWLPYYTFSTFLQDLLAGLTVGMTEIPQGIAYATIAGLPPEHGLYSGLLDGLIYAILGGCKDLNIGPSSILSVLIQSAVLTAGTHAAILMTFLSGVIILTLGIMRLGFIIQFFSYPVFSGFICSACFQIGLGQLATLLGISGKTSTVIEAFITLAENISETKKWDAVLGASSLVFLLVLKQMSVFGSLQNRSDWSKTRNILGKLVFFISLSRSALVLIIGTSLAYYFREKSPFSITGHIAQKFPTFQTPPFSTTFNGTAYNFGGLVENYGITLVFLPLISVVEGLSIAKLFNGGKKLDAMQEMIAIGLCNLTGSFIGSLPVTGSFSRTVVNHTSGVKTTMAGFFTSIFLLLTLLFLTSTFYYVPKSSLAAILIAAIIYLFDYQAVILIWRTNRLDLIPFLTTFLCGLFISIDYGILIGAAVNLLFIFYASVRPKINVTKPERSGQNNVYMITPNDTLYFPAAEYLRSTVLGCKDEDVTVVIDGKYIRSVDITIAKCLASLSTEMTLKNRKIFLVDFKDSVKRVCLGVDETLREYFLSKEAWRNITKDEFELSVE